MSNLTSVEKLKAALKRADELALEVVTNGNDAPDKVEARREELLAMTQEEVVELLLKAEKVKSDKPFTIEQIARPLLEAPELAIFTYDQIASTIRKHAPEAKTTGKGIASYVQNHKEDWNVVPRERFKIDVAELLAVGQ